MSTEALTPSLELVPGERLRNFAADSKVADRVRREVWPLVQRAKDDRKFLSDQWRKFNHVFDMEHDEGQGYVGRSNLYMPSGRRAAETVVSQLVSATFPGEDYFGVEAKDPQWRAEGEYVRDVLKHQMEQMARVRTRAEAIYRQLAITGNTVAKVVHKRKTLKAMRRSRSRRGREENVLAVLYDGPVFEPVDINNVYFWPENVNDVSECRIVFEELSIPYAHLRQRAAEGVYDKDAVEGLAGYLTSEEKKRADEERVRSQGFGDREHNLMGSMVDIIELYIDFDPYADTWDEEREAYPFLMTLAANGTPLRATRNPFWHQQSPYLLGRMGTRVGRLYGSGVVEMIRGLCLLLNDQTNQGTDAATYSLNPVVLTNPDLLMGALSDIEPGVQWFVRDVNQSVKFMTPPSDVINNASILTAQSQSWINESAGAPPVLQGGSAPGRAFKTATGVGAAQNNAKLPLQEIVRLMEADMWEPMLSRFHIINEQFPNMELLDYLKYGRELKSADSLEAISGDWSYRWLASSQSDNRAIKGSQLMEAIQLLANPGVGQLLQMQQVTVNPEPLIRRLYTEVFGFRDVDQVLVKQAAQDMGIQMPPGAGGPAPEVGQAGMMPSATPENLNGNEAFNEVRMEADDIAGMMGGLT
jgi:hypothetical protein